eukprot:3762176-Amphidinium_carterae.1
MPFAVGPHNWISVSRRMRTATSLVQCGGLNHSLLEASGVPASQEEQSSAKHRLCHVLLTRRPQWNTYITRLNQ